MSGRRTDPIAQSVHDRLLKLAKDRKEDFNAYMTRYGIERLLYRLTRTRHGERFVLKGAALFVLWLGRVHRPTRDLDLLGAGQIDEAVLRGIFEDVCKVDVQPDGLEFNPASITVAEIREGQKYQGLRVHMRGTLGTTRISVQIDVGTGDAITPKPEEVDFPTLLNMPAPRIKIYPRETTVAEKLDAMLELGLKNSRMKDYYDIHILCQSFAFDGSVLRDAIAATLMRRRRSVIAGVPTGLADEFGADLTKVRQWTAFLRTHRASVEEPDLPSVVRTIREFLHPVLEAVAQQMAFDQTWPAGGPWCRRP